MFLKEKSLNRLFLLLLLAGSGLFFLSDYRHNADQTIVHTPAVDAKSHKLSKTRSPVSNHYESTKPPAQQDIPVLVSSREQYGPNAYKPYAQLSRREKLAELRRCFKIENGGVIVLKEFPYFSANPPDTEGQRRINQALERIADYCSGFDGWFIDGLMTDDAFRNSLPVLSDKIETQEEWDAYIEHLEQQLYESTGMDVDFLDQVDEDGVPEDHYRASLFFVAMLASDIWNPFEMDWESIGYFNRVILSYFFDKLKPDNFYVVINSLTAYDIPLPYRDKNEYLDVIYSIAILYRCRLGRPECAWGSYFTIESCASGEYACGRSAEEYILFRYSPMKMLFLNAVVDLMFQVSQQSEAVP